MNKESLVMVMNPIPNNASAHTLTDVLAADVSAVCL